MKLSFAMLGGLAFLACAVAEATDHSVAISADGSGIDLYAVTDKGVALVKGSPYVLPQSSAANPLTVHIVKINSKHDFVYAVYWNETGGYDPNIMVVGLKITDHGLVHRWSDGYTFDPTQFYSTTLATGANYAVLYGEPLGIGHGAMIFEQSGQDNFVGLKYAQNGPLLTSADVDENIAFYYLCYAGAQPPQVEVNNFKTGKSRTSIDPGFFASVCSSK